GGDKGQGKTETVASIDADLYHMKGIGGYKDSLGKLAERIKQAGEKKLEAPAPVADDKDIQPIKGDSVIGKEEKFDAKAPEKTKGNGNESMMGHEQETIGDRPDSPKDHPSIPTGNAQMGKEELDSEKTTKDKGTVIAKDNMESEAYKLAGKMLEAKIIEASQLQQKVDELKGYKLAQLKDIEKNLFIGKKGFNSVSDGLSQAVVISETSSEQMMQKNNKENLVKKLASLFSLERRNELADGNEDNDLRKVFNK
ncbi:MAG: hypothetical protein WC942_12225, partial [Clostridia bacterium]